MSRQQINKMACAASGDSDQPGHLLSLITCHCPIQFFIFQSHWNLRHLSYLATHWVHSRDWSDCADTHVDLILPWEPSHFVGFVMRLLIYGKNCLNQQADYLQTYWCSGSSTRASGLHPEGCGFDPSWVIPKTFKIVLAALSFALGIEKAELVGPVSL